MEQSEHTRYVANDWKESPYYAQAENPGFVALFWNEPSPFLRMFKQLDVKRIVEIACGHGRHVQHYIDRAESLTLVDVNIENIDFCRKRYPKEPRIRFYRNSGSDLSEVPDESCTAVFSYDAMVHFELFDVAAYLREAYRILRPGGKVLYHHSNYTGIVGLPHNSSSEFGWRNYMTCELFTHLAMRCGLRVLEQQTLEWGGKPNLDGLTLMQKPAK